MNNPYLTKIQKIKQEMNNCICRICGKKLSEHYDIYRFCRPNEKSLDYGDKFSPQAYYNLLKAKLQTAVEFLQMTKEILEDEIIDNLTEHFCICKDDIEVSPKDERCVSCKFIDSTFDETMKDINSALKEAGEEI